MSKTIPPAVIFHVPHSSTVIPPAVRGQFVLNENDLTRELVFMTDHLTLDLVAAYPGHASIIDAKVSRLVVDVERFANDEQEPMSQRGMGVIYENTHDMRQLRRKISWAERNDLLNEWYVPHHQRLTNAVDEALINHGNALIIDVHSFPTKPLPYEVDQQAPRPEICIGTDGFHTLPELSRVAQELFQSLGLQVGANTPFLGALVPLKHYREDERVMALMLEIRRDQYLDEGAARPSEKYASFQAVLHDAIAGLVEHSLSKAAGLESRRSKEYL